MLTLFAFSGDNWGRPEQEVRGLMSLFAAYLRSEADRCIENGKKSEVTIAVDNKQLRMRVNGKDTVLKADVWTTSFWKLADAQYHNKKIPIIESDTGKSLDFIEVKGRVVGGTNFVLTRQEAVTALNKADHSVLALVQVAELSQEPHAFAFHPLVEGDQRMGQVRQRPVQVGATGLLQHLF